MKRMGADGMMAGMDCRAPSPWGPRIRTNEGGTSAGRVYVVYCGLYEAFVGGEAWLSQDRAVSGR